jgi:hypothetical protein
MLRALARARRGPATFAGLAEARPNLDMLSAMEYPHWMMMAGTILVAAGFIGLAFHRNRNVETDQKKPGRERAKSDDTPEPETDLPEDEDPEDVPLFLRSDKH